MILLLFIFFDHKEIVVALFILLRKHFVEKVLDFVAIFALVTILLGNYTRPCSSTLSTFIILFIAIFHSTIEALISNNEVSTLVSLICLAKFVNLFKSLCLLVLLSI